MIRRNRKCLIATPTYDSDTIKAELRVVENYRDFTTCVNGLIRSITGEIGNPHRFFDHNRIELSLNDPDNEDRSWMIRSDIVREDRFFMNVSRDEVMQAINDVPQNRDIMRLRSLSPLRILTFLLGPKKIAASKSAAYALVAAASHGAADFTHTFLRPHYDANRIPEDERSSNLHNFDRRGRNANLVNFRFEGSNIIYNHFDAGNFMWGAWTRLIGLTSAEVWAGSNLNEFYRLGDSAADQRAIFAGRRYFSKTEI